jgi:hypothetical protein
VIVTPAGDDSGATACSFLAECSFLVDGTPEATDTSAGRQPTASALAERSFLAGITEATPKPAGGDAQASEAALARRKRLAQLTPSVQPFLNLGVPAAVSSGARDCRASISPCPQAGGLQTVISGEVLDARAHLQPGR